jgi:hypothetical protein
MSESRKMRMMELVVGGEIRADHRWRMRVLKEAKRRGDDQSTVHSSQVITL